MPGKKKCRILREIRRRIADENDIPFVTEECRYKEDCKGTCPRCESELRYLEQQLEKRRALGKRVTVSAVALGLAATLAGCDRLRPIDYLEGDVPMSIEETEPESGYDPAGNANATVYGPPETEAPEESFDPGYNVESNIYGPPPMMESAANDG